MLPLTMLVTFALITMLGGHRLAGSPGGRSDEGEARPSRAQEASPPLGAVFTCYREARHRTRLDDDTIAELCQSAADASPVDCYLDARRRTYLSIAGALSLCHCATSTEPVQCYVDGYQTTRLEPEKILSLCSPTEHLRLEPDCSPSR